MLGNADQLETEYMLAEQDKWWMNGNCSDVRI